jgi:hypothetical protein
MITRFVANEAKCSKTLTERECMYLAQNQIMGKRKQQLISKIMYSKDDTDTAIYNINTKQHAKK